MSGGPTLSPILESRISDAGASVYRWYEEGAASVVDPHGRLAALSRLSTTGAWLTTAGASGWALTAASTPAWGAAVGGLLTLGVFTGAGRPRWRFPAAAAVVVGLALTPSPAAAALAVALTVATRRTGRPITLTAIVMLTTIAAAIGAGGSLAVAAATALTAGFNIWAGHIPLPAFRARVSEREMSTVVIPAPPSRLPWLVRARHRRTVRRAGSNGPIYDRVAPDGTQLRIDQRAAGAVGERRTAAILLALPRGRGIRVLHDVALPGADVANIDHLVLTKGGAIVIDTKMFGSRTNQGQVLTQGGRVVERNNRNPEGRDLTRDLRNLLWAARAIRGTLGVPVTGILSAHYADVDTGIAVCSEHAILAEVIPSKDLLARIQMQVDHPIVTGNAYRKAVWALTKLTSATSNDAPLVVRPLGCASAARRAPATPTITITEGGAPLSPVSPPANEDTAPSAPTGDQGPVEKGAWGGGPQAAATHPNTTHPNTTHDTPQAPDQIGQAPRGHLTLAEEAQRIIESRWEQMEASRGAADAAPDDLPEEFRSVDIGTPLSIVTITATTVRDDPVVAMSRPQYGVKDTIYVWVANPVAWESHQRTGRHVIVSTITLDRLIRRTT